MINSVCKCDGSITEFDDKKIYAAISYAYSDVYGELSEEKEEEIEQITDDVVDTINFFNDTIHVETIQDIIENRLMESSRKDVARAFILYRNERTRVRERNSRIIQAVMNRANPNTRNDRSNANVNERSFSGREKEASATIGKMIALDYGGLSEEVAKAHKDMLVYQHDLEKAIYGVHNCLNLNFQEIFTHGFKTRNGDVRPPTSFSTACQLYAVAFQCQSQVQFGGVGSIHTDIDLAPFVKLSFYKHYADGCKYIGHLDKDNIDKKISYAKQHSLSIEDDYFKQDNEIYIYAIDMLNKEGLQSAQGLYHNLNTLESRQGSQVPFTSINFGRDKSAEGRKVSEWLMAASLDGIGKHHLTSIFPIGIFQYKEGCNANPGDKNYDLKQLALKSMSKRIYPNWCNCNYSQAHEDENNPDTYFATMGALAGHEHLYIKKGNGTPIDMSIKEFFETIKTKEDIKGRAMQLYYNKSPLDIPTDINWRHKQIKSNSGIKALSGVYKITYIPQDVSYIGSSKNIQQRVRDHKKDIRHTGGLDCGLFFGDANIDNYSFEVIEYTDDYKDAEKKYIQLIPNANYKGTSSKFYKNVGITKGRGSDTRPNIVMNPNIPQEYISLEDFDYKVLDRNNQWVKIKHIFKNDKMNTPLMMHITYRENDKVYTLCCTEDHPLWNGERFVRADNFKVGDYLYRADELALEVVEIKYHTDRVDSYDIGTETGSFIGSDIIMHNCRTMVGYDRNGLGYIRQGRGNNVPNTIILPNLGIRYGICLGDRTEPDLDGFWNAFEDTLKLTEKGLLERFAIMVQQKPTAAPFMYQNNTIQDARKCKDNVYESLKHNTLAIGYIGIAEMCQALFGENHVHSKRAHDFALSVVKRIYDYAIEASERNGLNFSCYATPAESLCRTALVSLREQYGIIDGVTSHEYLTNSHHVPVWEKVSIFEKLECEAPFCKYPTGGNITYVELDSTFVKNTKAVESIIDYAFKVLDIPYLAFNFPIDNCLDCGYQGEFNDCCPECGSKNIQQLRRVTGYLTTDWHNFNDGKQSEVQERVKHEIC
ncbi:ribonucleoside-triphosphate reductase [Ruminococcus albus SY3]|uniref:Ribonucleoside-triphosphate reductase n=2 Tax=Ruminococcus albus TaxID=1264 RepID=A0A011VSS7_RUMAL|nr:ribonucleoside-triphosphate reductase [Ruminococcus albus SY3]